MTNPLISSLASGFKQSQAALSFCYPGFHANELHDALAGGPVSINERTAWAMAWGASLAGARSVCSFKNVGLNDAADPFLASVQLGCNAGLVLVLFEDCDIEHSQNRMDSRPYFDFFGGFWMEPTSLADAWQMATRSFAISEHLQTPVVIRITNALYAKQSSPSETNLRNSEQSPQGPNSFPRNPQRWVAHPVNANMQEESRLRRNRLAISTAEDIFRRTNTALLTEDTPITRIICGARRDVSAENALFLNTLPLPEQSLISLRPRIENLPVHENGCPFLWQKLRLLFSSFQAAQVSMNNTRLRFKYHCNDNHERLFRALRSISHRVVFGDLGQFTNDPAKTVDACLCYGASIAAASGFLLADSQARTFAISGDAAFAHAGALALLDAVSRKIPLDVIVFLNGGAQGTGGQKVPDVQHGFINNPNIDAFCFSTENLPEMISVINAKPTRTRVVFLNTQQWS
jgi:indolepyruvate ferredoxin oxidoreductase, alpha subunit